MKFVGFNSSFTFVSNPTEFGNRKHPLFVVCSGNGIDSSIIHSI